MHSTPADLPRRPSVRASRPADFSSRRRRGSLRARSLRVPAAFALSLLLAAAGARAQTMVVQNDTLIDFGSGAIQAGFVGGESAAAWLTSPCDGEITHVRILWLSLSGSAPDSLEDAITLFEAGTFPAPGAQLTQLSGPVMQDGGLNEFALPLPIAVAEDETFVVSFRFLNSPPGLGPSVVTDVDGCQEGRNAIFAIPPSIWFSSCLLGVSGDFVIRAVVECSGTPVPLIFEDDFETGDTSVWSMTAGGS